MGRNWFGTQGPTWKTTVPVEPKPSSRIIDVLEEIRDELKGLREDVAKLHRVVYDKSLPPHRVQSGW